MNTPRKYYYDTMNIEKLLWAFETAKQTGQTVMVSCDKEKEPDFLVGQTRCDLLQFEVSVCPDGAIGIFPSLLHYEVRPYRHPILNRPEEPDVEETETILCPEFADSNSGGK